MSLRIFFVHKMHVIGTNQLDIILLGQFYDFRIRYLLQIVCLMIGTSYRSFMSLQFQIEIASKQILVPLNSFFCFFYLSLKNFSRHFPCKTGRTNNQSLVIFFQFHTVSTRTHVKAFRPSLGHQFNQVVIALLIFSQHHQVITALVRLSFLIK